MPHEKDPSTWPLLATIIATTALGLLWVYAGTTVRRDEILAPAVAVNTPMPSLPFMTGMSRDFCDKMRRDMTNDAVEFDPDSAFDMAMVRAWDTDCQSRHGISIMK
jgi:hypothetical protein